MRKISTITMLTLLCTAAFAQQTGTFTDTRNKKAYKTVKIADFTWMADNLNFKAKGSKCSGEDLEIQTECAKYGKEACSDWADGAVDCSKPCLEYKKPTAKQIQDKNKEVQANCEKFGRLYEWEAAKTACPSGWHLPSQKELDILRNTALASGDRWPTDYQGFSALPTNDNRQLSFWGVEADTTTPTSYDLRYIGSQRTDKAVLHSVRCIQGKSAEEAIEAVEKSAVENTIGKQFNPKINYGSITDSRDKTTYKTVKIGNQTWTAENLNYDAEGSKCYKDKDYYCKRDGRLYEWATAKTACPAGWHLPTETEWKTLAEAVGGISTAGTKLKVTSGWVEKYDSKKQVNGTDDFGFSAIPTGSGGWNGGKSFKDGNEALWWSTSEVNGYGKTSGISNSESNTGELKLSINEKTLLFSIRCVQGEAPKEEPAPKQAEKPKEQAKEQPKEQPKQQSANESCQITFPKKTCLSMPKGACKMSGGKVVDKCP